jgi:hypothetical protein
MVIPTGFEPVAYSLGNCRSILLSYGTLCSRYQKTFHDCTLLRSLRTIFAAMTTLAVLAGAGPAGAAPLPCAPEEAVPTEIAGIDADGIIRFKGGFRIRLANIVWPDHLEPGRRAALVTLLSETLAGQRLSWKPAAGPDRWGVTPAHLFVQEPDGTHPPFWLQAGLTETGHVPAWPEPASASCWNNLVAHEEIALKARRAYWAPRAQSARHRLIQTHRDAHAGRRHVALWRVQNVKPWHSLHFVNIVPSFRGAPSIGLTRKQVTALNDAGKNPVQWNGKWIVARFIVGQAGLSRIRVEAINPVSEPFGHR